MAEQQNNVRIITIITHNDRWDRKLAKPNCIQRVADLSAECSVAFCSRGIRQELSRQPSSRRGEIRVQNIEAKHFRKIEIFHFKD
jgi:hypothetical protein